MTIQAQYGGICVVCGVAFPSGVRIEWTRGVGARHVSDQDCEAARALASKQPTYVVELSAVVAFLSGARERGLSNPKVRVLAPPAYRKHFGPTTEMRLSLAGGSSQYPGAVQVSVNRRWVGRVETTGKVAGQISREPETIALLEAIALDPVKAAKEYAALMGQCSFCGKVIVEEGSVEVGYGPVCARRFDLPHVYLGTPQPSFPPIYDEVVEADPQS